jgi:nicotinamidase/pyrazinamidase
MAQITFTRDLNVTENPKFILLIIDPQNDFHNGGSLMVDHAEEDALITSAFITKNIDIIDEIFVTLDSHHKKHIAHKAFWVRTDKENGNQVLAPFSMLSHNGKEDTDCLYKYDPKTNEVDLKEGWRPKDISLKNWAIDYSKKLTNGVNNFKLTIWPDHCLIGTSGHAIQDDIQKALSQWSRHQKNLNKTIKYICKGMNCLTEMYSAIEAEVPINSDQSTTCNVELLMELGKTTYLLVAGQALTHCVNYTVRDILKYWYGKTYKNQVEEKALTLKGKPLTLVKTITEVGNIIILKDCMSPVARFEGAGEQFLRDAAKAGCRVVCASELEGLKIGLK